MVIDSEHLHVFLLIAADLLGETSVAQLSLGQRPVHYTIFTLPGSGRPHLLLIPMEPKQTMPAAQEQSGRLMSSKASRSSSKC